MFYNTELSLTPVGNQNNKHLEIGGQMLFLSFKWLYDEHASICQILQSILNSLLSVFLLMLLLYTE